MIKFSCPHCGKDVSAADQHAGKKGRCPGCQEVFTIPAGNAAVKAAPAAARKTGPALPPRASGGVARPRKPAPPPEDDDEEAIAEAPRKSGARRARPAEEDLDDLDEVEAYEEDEERDEEEEERPRKKKRKKRRGKYADCPDCGCRGDATAVGFTWWGGILGPRLFSHVRCNRCGTCYNGKKGDYNTTRIAIYVGVGVALGLALAVAGIMAGR